LSYDAISPIDGRYRREAEPLASYFSDRATTGARVRVELAYLGLLVELGVAPRGKVPRVKADMRALQSLEEELGHDVKAVEVYLRERLRDSGPKALASYVHLGLTSEDTNSLAFAILLRDAMREIMVPAYSLLATSLAAIARREASTVMVARTHGRPAVPTTFGKEMAVFAVRVAERVSYLGSLVPMAKFSGAVGTYASFGAMGSIDWKGELQKFVEGFGVDAAGYSTQVVPGERLSDILHGVINVNQLISSLSRDLWLYQTLDYVHFLRPGKVSSSTMPQKVNPVDLENAEGQADISNSMLVMIAYRLQQTRMQRDLSDSVVRRMTGQALAHSLVACTRLAASLKAMKVERGTMAADLRGHPEVLAEREQIRRRLAGDARGYEEVKESLERGEFASSMDPARYVGLAPRLARETPGVVLRLLRRGKPRTLGKSQF
jgi:adenylosuccinate lyase